MNEMWKDVPGYGGLYQVSNTGKVKSLGRVINEQWYDGTHCRTRVFPEKLLKQKTDTNGYLSVGLHKINGERKRLRVHRIVAITFLDNPNNLPCINHIDECITNNNVNNLEWCTQTYNMNYGNRKAKYRKSRGTKVDRLNLEGNYIDTWESMTYAAEIVYKNKFKEVDIRNNCLGKINRVLNYKWRFTNES